MVWGFSKQQQPHNLHNHSLQASQYPEQNSLMVRLLKASWLSLKSDQSVPRATPTSMLLLFTLITTKLCTWRWLSTCHWRLSSLLLKAYMQVMVGFLVVALFCLNVVHKNTLQGKSGNEFSAQETRPLKKTKKQTTKRVIWPFTQTFRRTKALFLCFQKNKWETILFSQTISGNV